MHITVNLDLLIMWAHLFLVGRKKKNFSDHDYEIISHFEMMHSIHIEGFKMTIGNAELSFHLMAK